MSWNEKVGAIIGIAGLLNLIGLAVTALIAGYSYVFTGHAIWLLVDAERAAVWLLMTGVMLGSALVLVNLD